MRKCLDAGRTWRRCSVGWLLRGTGCGCVGRESGGCCRSALLLSPRSFRTDQSIVDIHEDQLLQSEELVAQTSFSCLLGPPNEAASEVIASPLLVTLEFLLIHSSRPPYRSPSPSYPRVWKLAHPPPLPACKNTRIGQNSHRGTESLSCRARDCACGQ